MAKIPVYETGQTRISDLPNVRQTSVASPELFVGISGARSLAEAGEGATKIGVAGMRYASDLQEKEDLAVIKKSESEFLTDISNFELAGKQKLGLNAATLPSLSDDYYEEAVKKHSETLNDRQKAIFGNIAARHAPSFKNSMYAHSADQINKAQEASFKSSLEAYQSSAAANPAAAPELNKELDRTLQAWGQIKGLDKATLDRAKIEEKTKLHMAVLGTLEQSGDIDAMKGYFYSNIKEIDGVKQTEIKKAIETSDRSRMVQSFADDVVDKQNLGLEGSLKAAREKFDGEDEKHAVTEIKQRYAEKQAIQQEQENKDYDYAWQVAVEQKKGIKGISPSVWARMPAKDKRSILSELSGGSKATNQSVWYDLYTQSMNDPKAFIGQDLRKFKDSLSDSDFQELTKRQIAVKSDIDKPDKLKRVYTVGQQVTQIIDSIGIPATSNNKETRDRRALATRAVSDALTREAAAKGKEVDQLTDVEVQGVADRVLIKGSVSREWWPDKDKYAFELKPEEKAKFRIDFDQVPADFVAEARAFASKKGKKISDEDIAIKYREWINKQ